MQTKFALTINGWKIITGIDNVSRVVHLSLRIVTKQFIVTPETIIVMKCGLWYLGLLISKDLLPHCLPFWNMGWVNKVYSLIIFLALHFDAMATASHAVFSLLPIFRKVAFSTRLTCLSATPANRLFSESYFSYDLFHAWHVGTGKTFLASRLAALSMSWARDLYRRKILPILCWFQKESMSSNVATNMHL